MFMGQSNNGTTHAGPKRKIQIGAALRKHTDGLTLRELAVQTGLVSSSISATLKLLLAAGDAVCEGDRWRWTGSAVLVPWADLNPRCRRIVRFLADESERSSKAIAEATEISREEVTRELSTLVRAGWATSREDGAGRGRCLHATITPDGLAAFRAVQAAEISTSSADAA
jgi:DNA-binding MarR family transcriptional regulator